MRPLEGGGSCVVAPDVVGSVAAVFAKSLSKMGSGEAVDVTVRTARARMEYIEGIFVDVRCDADLSEKVRSNIKM